MPPIRVTLTTALAVLALALAACGSGSDNAETSAGGKAGAGGEGGSEAARSGSASDAGGNAPAASGEAVRSAKVEIANFAYDPDPVTIRAGGKVTWIDRDSAPHTATADDGSFDTGTIEEGKLGSESFKQAGTFAYHCTIHPSMHGTIEVVE